MKLIVFDIPYTLELQIKASVLLWPLYCVIGPPWVIAYPGK